MSDGLCECGCGEKTRIAPQSKTAEGWVKGEPVRFVQGHNNRLRRLSSEEIIEDPETHCWLWQWGQTSHGYGVRWTGGELRGAHVVYYRDLVGPVPDGLELDHLCVTPRCVNPGHLEPVTHAENMRRYGDRRWGNACGKNHEFTPENTYIKPDGRRECRICQRAARRRRYARFGT